MFQNRNGKYSNATSVMFNKIYNIGFTIEYNNFELSTVCCIFGKFWGIIFRKSHTIPQPLYADCHPRQDTRYYS